MDANRIQYIKTLLREIKEPEYDFLRDFFDQPDVEERENCHEKFVVSFALNRARSRIESTKKHGKKTFGIDSLVNILSNLDPTMLLDFYNFRSNGHIGTCFVFDNKLIGFEFVERTGSITKPGFNDDILKNH